MKSRLQAAVAVGRPLAMSSAVKDQLQQMTPCDSLMELQVSRPFMVPPFRSRRVRIIEDVFLLLYQVIWDEVGEPQAARDRVLLDIEQECLEVWRRKIDLANRCRAQLRQAIAEAEAELARICSAMGEPPIHVRQVCFCTHA